MCCSIAGRSTGAFEKTKTELQKQFDGEIHQMITKKDQEAAELRKELELFKRKMRTEIEELHSCGTCFKGGGTCPKSLCHFVHFCDTHAV